MGIFERAKVAEYPSATGETFALGTTIEELKQQQLELRAVLSKDLDNYEHAIFDTRLDYVEDRLRDLTKKKRRRDIVDHDALEQPKPRQRRSRQDHPWEWPGPIAPAGMEAVKLPNGTYNHCSTTDPAFASEEATAKDYEKVVAWASRFNWSSQIVAAHWGTLTGRGTGPLYTKTNLLLLQERIRAISDNRSKKQPQEQERTKVGIFSKAKTTPTEQTETVTLTSNAVPVLKEAAKQLKAQAEAQPKVTDQWEEQRYIDAADRLLDAGFIMYKTIETREQAEEILAKRNSAILELALVYEQFEKAKRGLEAFIEDISLVFDHQLEEFMIKNNPTGKKTWSLTYGDLVQRNKPETIALDTDHDPDGSLLQGWLKMQYDKKTEAVEAIDIRPLTSYSRDLNKLKEFYKAQYSKTGTPPVIPGIKRTPAEENAFSIAPSIDTAKKRIKEELKEKGLR